MVSDPPQYQVDANDSRSEDASCGEKQLISDIIDRWYEATLTDARDAAHDPSSQIVSGHSLKSEWEKKKTQQKRADEAKRQKREMMSVGGQSVRLDGKYTVKDIWKR